MCLCAYQDYLLFYACLHVYFNYNNNNIHTRTQLGKRNKNVIFSEDLYFMRNFELFKISKIKLNDPQIFANTYCQNTHKPKS